MNSTTGKYRANRVGWKNFTTVALGLLLSVAGSFAQATEPVTNETTGTETFYILGFVTIMLVIANLVVGGVIRIIANKPRNDDKRGKGGVMTIVLLLVGTLSATDTMAYSLFPNNSGSVVKVDESTLWMFLFLNVFLVATFVYQVKVLRYLIQQKYGIDSSRKKKQQRPLFQRWERKLTKAIPIEQESEVMTDHEYDGIRELDNELPPWWKWLFYLSIVFAVVYLAHYHVLETGDSIKTSFEKEMEEGDAAVAQYMMERALNVDESSVVALTSPAEISEGRTVFMANCVACHGEFAEGKPSLGANLTDEYWLHGGQIKDIFKTVKNGVAGTNMLSWEKEGLSPVQIQKVASFILTLKGTDPPNAQPPQGELYIPEGDVSESVEIEPDTTQTSAE